MVTEGCGLTANVKFLVLDAFRLSTALIVNENDPAKGECR